MLYEFHKELFKLEHQLQELCMRQVQSNILLHHQHIPAKRIGPLQNHVRVQFDAHKEADNSHALLKLNDLRKVVRAHEYIQFRAIVQQNVDIKLLVQTERFAVQNNFLLIKSNGFVEQ